MRFGLRCIITLAILYRAILVSQGGAETAGLSTTLADAVPAVQARLRDAVATRVGAYCRTDPTACLSGAAQMTGLVSAGATDGPPAPRRVRHGAIAAAAR